MAKLGHVSIIAHHAALETGLRPDQLAEQNGMSECVQRVLASLPEA